MHISPQMKRHLLISLSSDPILVLRDSPRAVLRLNNAKRKALHDMSKTMVTFASTPITKYNWSRYRYKEGFSLSVLYHYKELAQARALWISTVNG